MSALSAVVDADSIDTGNRTRDAQVRSEKYLDALSYPDITFSCDDVQPRDGKWVAAGTVTAHGITAPVELTLERYDDTGVEVMLHASARIDRYAHHVTAGKGLVGRWITLDVKAVAAPVQ
jgi:polyisoprenoid-binding protein YceI